MALKISFARQRNTARFRPSTDRSIRAIARAATLAYRATAKLIEARGRQDIAQAGAFGARWTNGLSVESLPASGFTIRNSMTIGHDQLGARNFEFGGIVKGKPTLWVPLSFSDAKGVKASNYPGGLFRVDRNGGKPLLLSIRDRKPKYVGLSQVRIPKKWHLRTIAQRAMREDFPQFYERYLNGAING